MALLFLFESAPEEEMNIHFVSLGCPRNLVDTETMIGQVLEAGHTVSSDPSAAQCVVINTCAFVRPAVEESIDAILEMARWKDESPERRLIVAGCLPQRYGEALVDTLSEVDVFLGTGAFHQIGDVIDAAPGDLCRICLPPLEAVPEAVASFPRLQTTAAHTAYLKIAEGCSGRCTYCIIPKLRGPQRSRPSEGVISEAEGLVRAGVKELVLVAQNTMAYGQDRGGDETDLPALLERLARIPGLAWIRLLYGHPDFISEPLMTTMASHPNICPYLDIPLQHASKRILRAMGRSHDTARNVTLLEDLRRRIPGVALRTTFITGFPGETERDFQVLMDFVETVRFDHVGVFTYSDDTDLPSNRLSDHVDNTIKQARFDRLMQHQAAISRENNEALVGTVQQILVEGGAEGDTSVMVGRTARQAPEIDGIVYIEGGTPRPGTFVDVAITKAHDYDLTGHLK